MSTDLSVDASHLAAQALSKAGAGLYRDAIELYEQALEQEESGEWRDHLSKCYLGSALDFAGKDMPKEAAAHWEIYAENAPPPHEGYDCYIGWLLQTGQTGKAKTCLRHLSAAQLDVEYPALATLLGLLVLTALPDLRDVLPGNSACVSHLGLVEEALKAWRANDAQAAKAALKPLPFRSAFRDVRTLINAASSTSTEHARTLLARIPPHSPYAGAARLLLVYTRDGAALIHAWLQQDRPARRALADAKGFDSTQNEFLEKLFRQKELLSDQVKFDLALQYRSLFGKEAAERFCWSTLLDYPAGKPAFAEQFGALNEFEECRLDALRCEKEKSPGDANRHWRRCMESLDADDPANALRITLILKHMASQAPAEDGVRLLIESLNYDATDRAVYFEILDHYQRHDPNGPGFWQWLDHCLANFPRDGDFLTLAINAATRSKAANKAEKYARALLENNPVNRFAKQVLFKSHLARARRLIRSKESRRAEDEIEQADKFSPGKSYRMQAQLMRGFLDLAAKGDGTSGTQSIAQTLTAMYDDPATARFHLTVESVAMDLPPSTTGKALPAADDRPLSSKALSRLVELMRKSAEEGHSKRILLQGLRAIEPSLKQSLQEPEYPEETVVALCGQLADIGQFDLLRHWVAMAANRWKKPIWQYYDIFSRAGGDIRRCSIKELYVLQTSLKEARRQGDSRAVALIGRFLERRETSPRPVEAASCEGAREAPEEEAAPAMDYLFGHLPDAVMERLDARIEELMEAPSPDYVLEEMKKFLRNHRGLFAAATEMPDLFSALLLLKAAEDLGLDTGVRIEDVSAYFGIEDKAPTRRFPFSWPRFKLP